MHYKELKLNNVWRTCNKIRAAIFRVGINLWDHYLPLDPEKNCLISEAQFVSVLAGPLKESVGLTDQEINELTDYFRIQDGRIFYTQMCEVIHDSVPDFAKNRNFTSGLEWEDPLHVNRLALSEERRLHILITKIAAVANMRRLILRPYFQDYEMIAKNAGTVTIAHFARVLAYLGIIVSSEDFNLLVKKFVKDGYTINYVAFIAAVDEAVKYFIEKGIMDIGGDIVKQFPGRVITGELPKLPRPEIGKVLLASLIGKQDNFHPSLTAPTPDDDLATVIKRIQRHVLSSRLRVVEFFRDWDPLQCGRITTSQFQRGLEALGIGRTRRLCLSSPEIKMLVSYYTDPVDSSRVCWQAFENDINQVFTINRLEKHPSLRVVPPPGDLVDLKLKGAKDWQTINTSTRDLCEDTMSKIKEKATRRRVALRPTFCVTDPQRTGHVSRHQMRRCLVTNNIFLTEDEHFALDERFTDDMGFNYYLFLKELESKVPETSLYQTYQRKKKILNTPKPPKPVEDRETDIVAILAKIKAKVVTERIRVDEFLKDYDRHNEHAISELDFVRGLNLYHFNLNSNEVDTLVKVFRSPLRPKYVDYKRFSDTVEESFTQPSLERAPLLVPLQHIPSKDCDLNFLNFEERRRVSIAMQKLSKMPETEMNLIDLFKDFDKRNCGTVTAEQLRKIFSVRGFHHIISNNEFNALCKCFSFERGFREEVNYRALCDALNLSFYAEKYKSF